MNSNRAASITTALVVGTAVGAIVVPIWRERLAAPEVEMRAALDFTLVDPPRAPAVVPSATDDRGSARDTPVAAASAR